MKTFPPGYLSHVLSECTTLAACWRVIRRDGVELLGTEADADVEITTGDYAGLYLARTPITASDIRSTADMAVDNMEASGMLQDSDLSLDLNAADIEAGLLDDADVTTFVCNYLAPDVHQDVIRTGYIGNVSRTAEGAWRSEIRGLTQALSQGIVRTYSVGCDAELGDARCKVAMGPHTFAGSVTSVVVPRREFAVSFSGGAPAAGRLVAGKLTFTSGANDGYAKEVREDTPNIRVFDKFPRTVAVGDTFSVTAGCLKRLLEDCLGVYDNVLNYRGHGVFVPGDTALLKVGRK